MSPEQCPECARFLSKAFVAGLEDGPAACPGCGAELGSTSFEQEQASGSNNLWPEGGAVTTEATSAGDRDAASTEAATGQPDASSQVSAAEPGAAGAESAPPTFDPLAGWDDDLGEDPYGPPASGPPPEAAIIAGAGAFGGLVGALLARRRVLGALLGFGVGAGAAAAAQEIWRLPE